MLTKLTSNTFVKPPAMDQDTIVERLNRLVGSRFRYHGLEWELFEVLRDEEIVVLQRSGGDHPARVQTDQYGQPHRLSIETLSLPMFDDGGGYSPELIDMLASKVTTGG